MVVYGHRACIAIYSYRRVKGRSHNAWPHVHLGATSAYVLNLDAVSGRWYQPWLFPSTLTVYIYIYIYVCFLMSNSMTNAWAAQGVYAFRFSTVWLLPFTLL